MDHIKNNGEQSKNSPQKAMSPTKNSQNNYQKSSKQKKRRNSSFGSDSSFDQAKEVDRKAETGNQIRELLLLSATNNIADNKMLAPQRDMAESFDAVEDV